MSNLGSFASAWIPTLHVGWRSMRGSRQKPSQPKPLPHLPGLLAGQESCLVLRLLQPQKLFGCNSSPWGLLLNQQLACACTSFTRQLQRQFGCCAGRGGRLWGGCSDGGVWGSHSQSPRQGQGQGQRQGQRQGLRLISDNTGAVRYGKLWRIPDGANLPGNMPKLGAMPHDWGFAKVQVCMLS